MAAANGTAYGVGNCAFWVAPSGGINQDVNPTGIPQNTMSLPATLIAGNLMTIASTQGLQTGQLVQPTFTSGVVGLTSGAGYFLYIASTTTIGFATSVGNAFAGTLITISGTPVGGNLQYNFVPTSGELGMILSVGVFSDAGNTYALNDGQIQQVNDLSGNTSGSGFAATQTTPANQPVFQGVGFYSDPDSAVGFIRAGNDNYGGSHRYLNLPASCEIGGGAIANEGTIIWAGRIMPEVSYGTGGLDGGSGSRFVYSIGSAPYFLELQSNNTINKIGIYDGDTGDHNAFPKNFSVPDMNPVVIAVRFSSASGSIGVAETKLYVGTNYTDTIASNLLASTQSGGTLPANVGLNIPQEIAEFIVFDRALTDAQIQTLIQQIQDRICGGFYNPQQIFFYGDSRTAGSSPDISIDVDLGLHRNWPNKALRRIGGRVNWAINIAQQGNSIAQQQAAWNLISASVDATDFTNVIAMGEIGINDAQFHRITAVTGNLNGTTTISGISSMTQIVVGQVVTDSTTPGNIPANTVVQSVNIAGSSCVVSNICGTATGDNLTFTSNATSVERGLTNLWNSMLTAGVTKIIAMTIPLGPATALDPTGISIVNAVNAWMRNPANIPSNVTICDNAADTRLGTSAPSGYQSSDGLHWTDAGYSVYAQNAALGTNATFAPSAVGKGSISSALGLNSSGGSSVAQQFNFTATGVTTTPSLSTATVLSSNDCAGSVTITAPAGSAIQVEIYGATDAVSSAVPLSAGLPFPFIVPANQSSTFFFTLPGAMYSIAFQFTAVTAGTYSVVVGGSI
jgi:hypothetical protein